MHELLRRQLERHFGAQIDAPPGWRAFLETVDATYRELEGERSASLDHPDGRAAEVPQQGVWMRTVLQAFPDLFLWLDREGEIVRAQAGDGWRSSIESDRLIGRSIQDISDEPARKSFLDAYDLAVKTETMASVEYSSTELGQVRYREARLLPLPGDGLLAIVRDITYRKLSEEALHNEKERLAVTLRSIADGVIATDVNGAVILMNSVAEELTGWALKDAFGLRVEVVFRPFDRQRNALLPHPVAEILGGRAAAEEGSSIVARDGAHRPIHSLTTAVAGAEQRVVGAVVVLRDMADLLRAEEEHIRSSKLESLGLLAGGIAHDYNNILAGIMSNLSVLAAYYAREEKVAEILADAELACHRAKELTRQLLTFSKGGAPVKTAASLPELIREAAVFALHGSNVTCSFDVAGDLCPVDIDVGQVSQVLNNLIINARQAMPQGGAITIAAANASADEARELPAPDRRYVKLSVIDRGYGISADVLGRIFDPYFTTKPGGSGLGLATSYSIIKRHDGAISASSRVGRGTTMTVYLPAAEKPTSLSPQTPRPLVQGQGRVLVMDDEEQILRASKRMLNHMGFECEVARDGAEAIARVERAMREGRPFDLVVMDLTIPGGMGGREAAAKLVAAFPEIRIVASSGYSNDPILQRHGEHGFAGILPKPYNLREMSDLIRKLLG
jgi:two-component system, cell cycle sensor histidine kinase and response regulator CckA